MTGNRMSQRAKTGAERRTSPRLEPTALASEISVSLHSCPEVTLVNISRGGALLRTGKMLRPNSKICLRISIAGMLSKVEGRVLRSQISSLIGGMQYNSAISFDEDLGLLEALAAAPELQGADAAETTVPDQPGITPMAQAEDLPQSECEPEYAPRDILVITPELVISNPDMLQALELNRW